VRADRDLLLANRASRATRPQRKMAEHLRHADAGKPRPRKGDLTGPEPLFRQSLRIGRMVLGDEHPDVAQGLNNLATLLQARGDLAGAEPLYCESLAGDLAQDSRRGAPERGVCP
jgi:hypothetical protein